MNRIMQKGKKRINPSLRPQIDTLKSKIRFAKNPFDGTGGAFKIALKELRAEGIIIAYDRKNVRYYNKKYILKSWGY
jgi:hypothetical protein